MNRRSRRRRSRAISKGVNNAGLLIANIFSRLTNHLTRRKNRDHLVVPGNGSPRHSPVNINDIDTALGLKSTFRKSGAKSDRKRNYKSKAKKRPSLAQLQK